MVQVNQLQKEITDLKRRGLIAEAVSINFRRRLTQSIKDRVHPAYEYSGPLDLTREVQQKVSREEVAGQVCEFFGGVIKNKSCPKAYSLVMSANPVSSCFSC
ncbi:hypothetical protein SEVIR_4G087903v4 [Setaria viridis]